MQENGLKVERDNYRFVFDIHQQTYALAVFISGDEEMRDDAIALALKPGDIDDLGEDLQDYTADKTAEHFAEGPYVETLVTKIVRNWLEDVEWRSLAHYVCHIAARRYTEESGS